ncbi:MFS transporter [Microbacterium sp. Root553]|uniref:MFS transporter n=1 Tax=Microbacterium sp. Root553 TaxID=1736556 RepID=UPI0006F2F25C|nr:MFS transporter [Microbacterium sp. Root553]KQZ24210.1 MFS transporter [Microbacterium sp. Root553]
MVRSTPTPWRVASIAGMASYIDAAAIVGTGTALVLYQGAGILDPAQIGILSSALTLAIAVGAFVGGGLGDRFGRRGVFLATMVLIFLGATGLVFAPNFALMLIGVIAVGLGCGADLPVSLATIAEASDDSNRGKLVGLSQVLWYSGIIATYALQLVIGGMGSLGGQIVFGHVALASFVVLILRLRLPESSEWKQARTERESGVATYRARTARIRDIFKRKDLLVAFLSLLVFYSLTNLAANTKGQFGTYVNVNVVGLTVQQSSLISLLTLPVSIVLAIWFMRIVDGRRRMLFFGFGVISLTAAFAVPALLGFSLATVLVAQLLFGFGAAFAFEGIMKVWTQESFPTLLRSSAQGAIIAAARVVAAALALWTPMLLSAPRVMYTILAVGVLVGALVAWFAFRSRGRGEGSLAPTDGEQISA